MPRSINIAVRKGDIELRVAGRGGGGWPEDVASVVDLDAVEPERDGDSGAGGEVLAIEGRARVAEARRLDLALELVNVFIVESESASWCIRRRCGRRSLAVGEMGQGEREAGSPATPAMVSDR